MRGVSEACDYQPLVLRQDRTCDPDWLSTIRIHHSLVPGRKNDSSALAPHAHALPNCFPAIFVPVALH